MEWVECLIIIKSNEFDVKHENAKHDDGRFDNSPKCC